MRVGSKDLNLPGTFPRESRYSRLGYSMGALVEPMRLNSEPREAKEIGLAAEVLGLGLKKVDWEGRVCAVGKLF